MHIKVLVKPCNIGCAKYKFVSVRVRSKHEGNIMNV